MIHTPLTQILRDAGYTPDDIYIHPVDARPSDYVPVWHVLEGMRKQDRQRDRVTEKNEHRVEGVLR